MGMVGCQGFLHLIFLNMANYRYNSPPMPMSPIAKKFLISSLIYFILGLLAQAVNVFDAWLGFNPLAYTAVSATMQILLVGWLTQLGLALVYARRRGVSGGEVQPEKWPMVVFVLFNLGLPLAILGQPGLMLFGGQWLGAMAAFGALLQLFAGLVFGYDIWRTVLVGRTARYHDQAPSGSETRVSGPESPGHGPG